MSCQGSKCEPLRLSTCKSSLDAVRRHQSTRHPPHNPRPMPARRCPLTFAPGHIVNVAENLPLMISWPALYADDRDRSSGYCCMVSWLPTSIMPCSHVHTQWNLLGSSSRITLTESPKLTAFRTGVRCMQPLPHSGYCQPRSPQPWLLT